MDTFLAILEPTLKWVFLALMFALPLAGLLTWAERRQSAMMQDRRGPNRANIGPFRLWGIVHFIADAVKMMVKEDFVPGRAHRFLFGLAPILALAPVLIAFAIIPFGPTVYWDKIGDVLPLADLNAWKAGNAAQPQWAAESYFTLQAFQVDFGLLFYFAILTLSNYGATIAGWASYNKWALLGGLRASSQMMSYEVTMGVSLMGIFLVMNTLNPSTMVAWQGSNPIYWGWAVQPLGLLLFLTAAIAETKRAPFDMPEGESEIIGYFIEYSGLRWGMFFLGEFIEIVFISMIITTVFFGGYQFPFLDPDGFRLGGQTLPLAQWAVVLIQIGTFCTKVVFFSWLQLSIRWTLPRVRPDQLMKIGWQKLLPLSLFNVMLTAFVAMWDRKVLLIVQAFLVLCILVYFFRERPKTLEQGAG